VLELGESVTYPDPCPCIVWGVSTETVSVYRFFTKLAVTVTLVLLVLTVHVVLVSLHVLSDQPANRYPADVFGLARSVTDLPQLTVVPPLTVPPAVGEADPLTVHRGVGVDVGLGVGVGVGARLKMAVAVLSPFITIRVVALVPLALPPHWLKTKPWFARARRLTVAPSVNVHRRKPPRKSLWPETALALADTVPPPEGDTVVVSVRVTGGGGGLAVKMAVTDLCAFMTTEQTPEPVQSPDQRLNW